MTSSSQSTPLSPEALSVVQLTSDYILPRITQSNPISFDFELHVDSPAKTISVVHSSVSNVDESPYHIINVDIGQLSASSKVSTVNLPVVRVLEPDTVCPICLVECEVGAEVNEMLCKHGFCGGCIGKWLRIDQSCPVCRFQMVDDNYENNKVWNIVLYVGDHVLDPDRTEIVVDPLNPDWIQVSGYDFDFDQNITSYNTDHVS